MIKEKLKNIPKSFTIKLGKKSITVNRKVLTAVIIALIAAIAAITIHSLSGKNQAESKEATAKVTRGNVENVIEGTGTVAATSQYEITSLVKGDVTKDYFSEGDTVEKGKLLYQLDTKNAESTIEKAKSALEKSQTAYDRAVETAQKQSVTATASGTITELNIKKGDEVKEGSQICKIVDYENLIITLPFNKNDAQRIYAGSSAVLSLENSSAKVYGTVTSVSTGTTINSYGVATSNVEIAVKNPGGIKEGDKATAIVGDYACNDSASFEYKSSVTVTSKGSGDVVSINYKKGDRVTNGATICSLVSSSVNQTLKDAKLSVEDAKVSLNDAYDDLDDYNITAPISGKIIQKNIKAGEKLDTNNSTTMAIIADLSELVFDMAIDELDISNIQVGQEVQITADAFEDLTFTGHVTNVSIVGTSNNGVTTYPVKVTIDNSEDSGLIPGMNVSASIVVESVQDVLRVPVSAVRRGNLVIVKDKSSDAKDAANENNKDNMPSPPQDDKNNKNDNNNNIMKDEKNVSSLFDIFTVTAKAESSQSDEADISQKRIENMKKALDVPDGYTVVTVETGLSDGTYIEIKSGLDEGDTVLLPDTSSKTENSKDNQQQMPGGGMGGAPGGMGGAPGSGMGGPGGGGGTPGGMR